VFTSCLRNEAATRACCVAAVIEIVRVARAGRGSSSLRGRAPLTVLTGANTRDRKRARTRVNVEAVDPGKVLQTPQKGPTAAKAREAARGLDKLGVTGSSPVPPIKKALPKGFFVARIDDGDLFVARKRLAKMFGQEVASCVTRASSRVPADPSPIDRVPDHQLCGLGLSCRRSRRPGAGAS
jgi:hypothetical protein